jgi:hypothetical protein
MVKNRSTPTRVVLLAAISFATPVSAQPRECPVAGTRIHWIADYCMSKLETDDEIAASPCIGKEVARAFTNDCGAKLYYKKTMCRLAISRKQRQDDINSCLADKEFKGATVRNGGVGR